jgi:hypothetical protein
MCPYDYPRTVPMGWGAPLSTPYSHRVQGSPLRAPQRPCCRTAPARCPRHASPDMPRARSRAGRSDTPRPQAHTPVARSGHAQVRKIGERGERARHTPIQLIVLEGTAHPKRTPRYYAAPTATMCPYGTREPYPWEGCPLSTPYSHRVQGSPLRVPQQPCCRTALPRCPRHAPPDMPRARSRAGRSDPSSAAHASAVGKQGARTVE